MCFQTYASEFKRKNLFMRLYRLFQVRKFFVLIEKTNNLKVIGEYALVLLECIDLSHKMLHIQISAKN